MILATPLGLLALLAIPAIIAIHLFRRRFPERRIAGLFLWQSVRQTPQEGRTRARLPVTLSLLLECVAALALAMILAGVRLSSSSVSEHLVVLLDDSASMAATNAAGRSARDRAIARTISEIDRLGAAARVTLLRSGERPAVLSGPAAYAVEARRALETWKPEAPDHSLALGIRLGRELAGPNGKLLIVTDAAPAARGDGEVAGALWAAVGEPLDNVGITAAQRSILPEEGRGSVSLTFANDSASAARRRLTISAAGKDVSARDLDLPPGVSSVSLPLPPGLPVVRVALSDDALLRDNAVTLAEPRPQVVGVQNRLKEGRGSEALARALESIAGVTKAEPGHLVFVHAEDLDAAAAPGVWRAAFGRPPARWLATGDVGDFVGPFVLEKRHPLLLGATLGGVVWPGAAPLAPNMVQPLASAGDRVLVGAALPAATRGEPVVLFNLDLDRTNLIRAPDWPILISNLIEMRRQSLPGPERWNYRLGEWIRVRLGRDPKGPLRFRGGAVERELPAGRQVEFIAPSPGGLLQILEGDAVLFELGVNFLDESETDLRRRSTADVGRLADAAGRRGENGPSSDPLFWVWLAIAGSAMLVNWCLLAPQPRRA